MKVLVLSPHASMMVPALESAGDTFWTPDPRIKPEDWPKADFVVSFGYRHIIKGEVLENYRGRMINIHISMLPYNRGASPNFWSWFDNTPKGISIHIIDEGIDTGPILCQQEMESYNFRWRTNATLLSTYHDLIVCGIGLFNRRWSRIRMDQTAIIPAYSKTSFHKIGEEAELLRMLGNLGHLTSVRDIEQFGLIYRGEDA